MKQVLLQWTYYVDIISVPDYIAENIKFYQLEFDLWINNLENHRNVKVLYDEELGLHECLSYTSDVFIEWLNDRHIKDNETKVAYIEKKLKEPTEEQRNLPIVYF